MCCVQTAGGRWALGRASCQAFFFGLVVAWLLLAWSLLDTPRLQPLTPAPVELLPDASPLPVAIVAKLDEYETAAEEIAEYMAFAA